MFIIDDSKYITEATPIAETKFIDSLECLPPENWNSLPIRGSFFQMCEWYAGNITSYYVEVLNDSGNQYFTFMDKAWMKPSEVLTKISPALGV